MGAALYEIENLKYGYHWGNQFTQVLNGASLEIARNSFVCLVGPSGMGKTTLLNLMGLLDRPLEGSLRLDGQELSRLSETELETLRLRKLGFVFQAFYLIPTLSVWENTSYFLPILGVPESEANERCEEVLKTLGLIDFRNKLPLELSGGQRQRVAIARALVKKPQVILADEPTANLDHKTAEDIIAVFRQLQAKEGVSFVFSTHDTNLVAYAEKVFAIRDGLVSAGSKT